ncbi:hypothetical protein [Paracraurococcus lichenis]|uniref:Bacteriocin n=1 Tax=Paracraurococcus lichenis TaxID=3064888 RepID=A0ABT9DZE3_9PROT|nr:hypothetical protein [Paracraurococcus sp. LOR1-02]MDO9709265.1 hypothetical protein [Paracraurococcus sp. LOR1-02]
MLEKSSVTTLTDAELDAVSGGYGFALIIGNANIGIAHNITGGAATGGTGGAGGRGGNGGVAVVGYANGGAGGSGGTGGLAVGGPGVGNNYFY